MKSFAELLTNTTVNTFGAQKLLDAHKAAIAQAVKAERERFIKILNGMRIVVWKKGDEMADAFVKGINNSIDRSIKILEADNEA